MAKLLFHRSGKTFYVKDPSKDYHCQFGVVPVKELQKASGRITTNTGKELAVIDSSFIDDYRRIKRGPQIIPLKDIGPIIAETGIDDKSRCLDAGTGSGALTFFLANITKEVISYDIREDFQEVAKKNADMLGMKNVHFQKKDIYEGITENDLDLITLDLPEPWKVITHAAAALKPGGFLVSYSPSVPQVADFVNGLDGSPFVHLKTIELIEREWDVAGRKVRPRSQQIGHSGFLSFARKVWRKV
ncbi:MAG: methyltransferase domain-containing protein [DPANN group archaeon]|nr:methyltransferase domain-containing protein [DPANN group archaeon]